MLIKIRKFIRKIVQYIKIIFGRDFTGRDI